MLKPRKNDDVEGKLVRQASFRWYFNVITALLITISGSIPFRNSDWGSIAGIAPSEIKIAASNMLRGLLDCTEPVADNPDVTFRANLVPAPNNGTINPRQNPPVWERISAIKPLRVMAGFFFAIMVIALFFIYYRNSRNVSENDSDDGSILVISY